MFLKRIKRMPRSSSWITIIGVLIAMVAATSIALLFTGSDSQVESDAALEPRAARVERVDGNVLIGSATEDEQPDWEEAIVNTPVAVGDRIYAREGGRASLALTGHNYVEVKPEASLDVLTLTDDRTQLALRSGSALFDIGELDEGELFEVATPSGAVDFVQPGLYQVGIDGDNTIISVLSGLAQVVGQGGTEFISQGQVFTLVSAIATEALASKLAPELAGGIVDDYYRYRYPDRYDGRYASYDTYVEDPFYYDPYRDSQSYSYLPVDIAGVRDLDYYGDWIEIDNYGHCWSPRVGADWAPYRNGYWDVDRLYGPTWISHEPWGWTPYHYGRWTFVNQRWFWVPVEVVRRPVYHPATVAFIPLTQTNQIAWVPLAPGEAYVPRYYDSDFRPRYFREVTVQRTFVNIHAPSAVTVVPLHALTEVITPHRIAQVDSNIIVRQRPTLDPFTIDGFRQLALSKKEARKRIKLERFERRALRRQVLTGRDPVFLPPQASVARSLRFERVSEERRKSKLKIDRSEQVIRARRRDGLPQVLLRRKQASDAVGAGKGRRRIDALTDRANMGDRSARKELRRMRRQERRAGRKPSGNQQSLLNQSSIQRQDQRNRLRQQMKEPTRLQRRQKAAGAAQVNAARRVQRQQMRQQRREQKRINRQPQGNVVQRQADAQQRGQMEQMRRQQRQLERRQSGIVHSQTQSREIRRRERMGQTGEQSQIRRAQKRSAQQQAVIQQQNRPSAAQSPQQIRQQIKARKQAGQQRQGKENTQRRRKP